MGIISMKLRNSAKGQHCTFCIPGVCTRDPATVVLCHAPSEVKGMGTKSDDWFAAFGCVACHEALDHRKLPKDEEQFYWLRGLQRTWSIWISSGLIVIPVDPITAKKRPKKKTYWPSRPMQSRNRFSKKRTSREEVELA